MARNAARLLALATTGAALLGLTTAPTQAAPALEATAAPYAFIGSGDQEAITIENQDWRVAQHVSERNQHHPGWSIHLSDERLNAGLPRQDFRARAEQGEAQGTSANTSGFISLMDQNKFDVPFLLFKIGGNNVVCEGFVGFENPRLFVRHVDGELHEVTDLTKPATAQYITSADSATDTRPLSLTVEIKRVTSPTQITQYGPFWKYAGRERVKADGHEIVMTYLDPDTRATKTFRLLAGARAVAC